MIRRCTEQDRDSIMTFLRQEPAYNIFPIGDIEHFGFDADFQQVYVELDASDSIISLFLRYRENGIYYAPKPFFNPEYLTVFDSYNLRFISGKSDIMDAVYPHIPQYRNRQFYFCATDKTTLQISPIDAQSITLLKDVSDMELLYDLLESIDEFSIAKIAKEDYVNNKKTSLQMGETYFIKEHNKIVASVAVTAETTVNGMVVAVATDKNHRNRGYASKLMQHLLYRYVMEKQKDLCLFYDNPDAGKIYIRLGFVPIGKWSMFERRDDLGTTHTT